MCPSDRRPDDAAVPRVSVLDLAPMVGLRYQASAERLGALLCPPYDVVDEQQREQLLEQDPDNAVSVILPRTEDGSNPYLAARATLDRWDDNDLVAPDPAPVLYVYEMRSPGGGVTRGLLGALALSAAEDGVVLPHENTMAGPVADRLALMEATEADLEPIYLVYDGGGPASAAVASVDRRPALAEAVTPDGTRHRLWALSDPEQLAQVAADLAGRRSLIADGHHRYATYRERQARRRPVDGAGPWDRGLALLVDSTSYGPEVHPIHRYLPRVPLADAVSALDGHASVQDVALTEAEQVLSGASGFSLVLTDGERATLVHHLDPALVEAARARATSAAERTGTTTATVAGPAGDPPAEPAALWNLDVTLLHRVLVPELWRLTDDVDHVGFAHSVQEAVTLARASGGTAVLLRATPVADVAAVAAAGARMPRKSTLFTPKPASGMVMRRFVDQPGPA